MAWFFTRIGFFSVVRDSKAIGDGVLVRARVREDLDNLREKYLPKLSRTTHEAGRDYPYRARCTHMDFATAIAAVALDIDYTNFKSEVARVQGWPRERLYSKVWGVMLGAERKLEDDRKDSAAGLTTVEHLGENEKSASEMDFEQGEFGLKITENIRQKAPKKAKLKK